MNLDLKKVIQKIDLIVVIAKCTVIYLSYLAGGFITGLFHKETQLMGAMLATISSVVVLQADLKTSIHLGWLRILGTFIGATVAYIYLTLFPFSIWGLVACTFVLEIICLLLNIPDNGKMATITLIWVLILSLKNTDLPPWENGLLRFIESSVGSVIGIIFAWLVQYLKVKTEKRKFNT